MQSSSLQILFYISCLEFSFCFAKKSVVFVLEVRSLRLEAVGSISYRSFHACQLKHYLWVWLGCAAFLQCIFHFHLSLGTTVKSCYLLPIPPLALRQPLTQKHDVLTKIGVNAFLLIVGTILLAVPMVVKLTIFFFNAVDLGLHNHCLAFLQ